MCMKPIGQLRTCRCVELCSWLSTHTHVHTNTHTHTHTHTHNAHTFTYNTNTNTHSNTHTQKKVAVKIPSSDKMEPKSVNSIMDDLKKEIETMFKLKHENIVSLLGISDGEGLKG